MTTPRPLHHAARLPIKVITLGALRMRKFVRPQTRKHADDDDTR